MTSVLPGSESLFFNCKEDIEGHLLKKVLANRKKCVGTEWEVFFVTSSGTAISRENGYRVFIELNLIFRSLGYHSSYLFEAPSENTKRIVGLNIENLGTIVPEAGFQFEFATSICNTPDDVLKKNEIAFFALCSAAQKLGCTPVFKGHLDGYAESAEGIERSRSLQWRDYYVGRFGENSWPLREAQDGTASTQVTIDSGADDFHEFFSALLLIEPAFSLFYANSHRSYVGVQAYSHFIPSQVLPLCGAWKASSPSETIEHIVERLLSMEVPFSPDPAHPTLYKAEKLALGKPPCVLDIMKEGRLNEKMLNNLGGFFYTRPALRDFSNALIEIRGIDSLPMPELVAEVSERVASLVYCDSKRKQLLNDYKYLKPSDIFQLHLASSHYNRQGALNSYVAGIKVQDFVSDLIKRSEAPRTAQSYFTSLNPRGFLPLAA